MNLEELEDYFCHNKFDCDTLRMTFTGGEMHLMVGTVTQELEDYRDDLTDKGISRAKDFLTGKMEESYYVDHFDESFNVNISYDDISIVVTSIKHCLDRDDYSMRAYLRAVKLIARFAEICIKDYEEAL